MYNALSHSHSGIRYIVLFLLISVIIHSIKEIMTKGQASRSLQKHAHIAVYAFYLNLLIGIWLYFISDKVVFGPDTMKEALYRFFTMEHPLMVIISLVIIRMGMFRAKRNATAKSNRTIMISFIIGLIVLLAAIPWPMRTALGVGWF